jgi:DNA polymerase-4
MLCYLLERACSWLRFRGQVTRGLTLTIRYGDYRRAAGRESFRTPTAEDGLLREAARERFGLLYQRRLPLRWLGIELAPLVAAATSPPLFSDPESERTQRLQEAKDQIRHRFGILALRSGETLLLDEQLDHDRENFRLRTPCLTR